MVDRDPRQRLESGQQGRDRGKLVALVVPLEPWVREIVGDFLQAEHVEVGDALRLGDDARRIDAAVDATAPLHVPGEDLHRLPAYAAAPVFMATHRKGAAIITNRPGAAPGKRTHGSRSCVGCATLRYGFGAFDGSNSPRLVANIHR